MITLVILFIALGITLIAVVFSANALFNTLKFGLPYVSTPDWAIDWLVKNVPLTERDEVYELGCGDARVLAALGKVHPETKFIGIEIQWWPYLLALWRTRHQKNITIRHADFLKQDLTKATLVYGFFITVMMPKVAEKLAASVQAGTTVISFGFELPGWVATESIPRPDGKRGSKIRIYRAAKKAENT